MARDVNALIQNFSPVMYLMHLAMRLDMFDLEYWRVELLRDRRKAYEDELTIQAARVGCPTRKGALTNGSVLSELNQMCIDDAASIVNTFNYELATAIIHIRTELPTANRATYAARLREWAEQRKQWKVKQIAQYTELSARSLAQQDFYRFNAIDGVAVMIPEEAVCPVCQGWINRGEVPLPVAMNNPPPYHVNCPHEWETYADRVTKEECKDLWMGGR